jgi:hypothetical protein
VHRAVHWLDRTVREERDLIHGADTLCGAVERRLMTGEIAIAAIFIPGIFTSMPNSSALRLVGPSNRLIGLPTNECRQAASTARCRAE